MTAIQARLISGDVNVHTGHNGCAVWTDHDSD
ncbi:hypothetical protein H4W33_005222 [Kibdelosporangium phytohabitans]|nr:hypothetical protein [Kibdelosporangium phytohabitans]